MRLLMDELYKITSQKIVRISFAVVVLIQLFVFFTVGVFSEVSVVNGVTYNGVAAIKMDREITEEFSGELTDEKVEQIIEKYDFLQMDKEAYSMKYNYLNQFVFKNGLCDGNWNSNQDPSHTIAIADSAMGQFLEERNMVPMLEYVRGWDVFETLVCMGAILVCLFLIIALTPVFAEEYSMNTANILLTTVHGKKKDIVMKILAAFLFAVLSFLSIVGLNFLLTGIFYGFDGLGSWYGSVSGMWFEMEEGVSVSFLSIGQFLLVMLGIMLLGVLMLTAFILFSSAAAKKPFGALVVALVFYILPGAGWFYMTLVDVSDQVSLIIRRVIFCSPLYSCMNGTTQYSLMPVMYLWRGSGFLIVVAPSIFFAYRLYRNHQVA